MGNTCSEGRQTWDVRDLWKAAEGHTPRRVPIRTLCDFDNLLDSHTWSRHGDWVKPLTVREVLEHARRVEQADLSYPVILSPEGWIADGVHRVVRALRDGLDEILVVQLPEMPEELNGVTDDPF